MSSRLFRIASTLVTVSCQFHKLLHQKNMLKGGSFYSRGTQVVTPAECWCQGVSHGTVALNAYLITPLFLVSGCTLLH